MPSVSGNAQFWSLTEVLHCSLAECETGSRGQQHKSLSWAPPGSVGSFYTQEEETLGIPTWKKSCGFRSGELAGQGCGVLCEITRVPKYSWMSLMVSCAVCGWPHLAGTTGWHECPRTFAALPSRTSWKSGGIVPQLPFGCAPVRLQTKRVDSARAANSAPRGALQAVQRSLLNYVRSRIRPEPVVLGVETPVEFETSFE